MSKKKKQRGRSHKTLPQKMSARSGRKFIRMVTEQADEGIQHNLTVEINDNIISTNIVSAEKVELQVDNPKISELIINALSRGYSVLLTLTTLDVQEKQYVRGWMANAGVIYPVKGEDMESSFREQMKKDGLNPIEELKNTVFKDAESVIPM